MTSCTTPAATSGTMEARSRRLIHTAGAIIIGDEVLNGKVGAGASSAISTRLIIFS